MTLQEINMTSCDIRSDLIHVMSDSMHTKSYEFIRYQIYFQLSQILTHEKSPELKIVWVKHDFAWVNLWVKMSEIWLCED